MLRHNETIALIIPTGIGADIGGYAGDGGKIARMFARYFNVITHPNVVNGGILSAVTEDILYTEGYILDEFFKGNLSLVPLDTYDKNPIGVIFDKSIPDDILNVHINTINAMKEVKGLDIPYFEITKEDIGIEFYIKNNISTGIVKNEKTLLHSAKSLINKGIKALGVVCYFKDDITNDDYEAGIGVDPIGGIEAVISHYLSKELMIPVAHSPAFSEIEITTNLSNKKVASENISSTYLPCILEGLNRAPFIDVENKKGIKNKDIKALIVPYRALGSPAVLAALENNIKILTVKNETKTSIGCLELGADDIMEYNSYEALLNALIKG